MRLPKPVRLSVGAEMEKLKSDPIKSPAHYQLACGIQAVTITADLPFCVGSAVKYLLRAGKKGDAIEDLRKAARMIQYEIQRLETGLVDPGLLP